MIIVQVLNSSLSRLEAAPTRTEEFVEAASIREGEIKTAIEPRYL
jgi:hypothetical protein